VLVILGRSSASIYHEDVASVSRGRLRDFLSKEVGAKIQNYLRGSCPQLSKE